MPDQQTAYDAIPYPSNPFRQTRPERLAAIAKLFGLDAAPPEKCRVLELGCSMGGNLIVMAQDHPRSQFVGIDASSAQIAEGWKTVDLLALKNLRLAHVDILDIGPDFGEFDYIISHGVFSWVPTRVQNKMFEVCQRHLAANGVAYISYNTYPGWHIRGIVRDMMLYRGMQFADPEARLAQAKELVGFVAEATKGADTPYQRVLQSELKHMGQLEDYYLHHEHLEENNQPIYFHDFARRLAVNGLQYLGDADFSTMVSTNFSAEVAAKLHELGAHDILQMEQYMDFVRCRYFRKSLICRSSVQLNRSLTPALVRGVLLSTEAEAVGKEDAAGTLRFKTPAGQSISCKSPLTKAALVHLGEQWPMPVVFADLFHACGNGEASEEEFLAGEMLICMAAGVVEWRLSPVPFTVTVARFPATSRLARLQAERGYKITNLRSEVITLDEIHRQTLRHLDGRHDIAALTDALMALVLSGVLVLHRDDDNEPVDDKKEMRRLLGPALAKVLANLAKRALLARVNA